MTNELKPLSDGERDALRALWTLGPSQVRDVQEWLEARERQWAYTTAKTILDRLEAKGYARRDRSEAAHVYHPTFSREDLARLRVGELRDELFGGAAGPLVRALVDGGLSVEEVQALRDSLDALEQGGAR
jgi:predicted transcriptional regulator